jgi:hypothetical protein
VDPLGCQEDPRSQVVYHFLADDNVVSSPKQLSQCRLPKNAVAGKRPEIVSNPYVLDELELAFAKVAVGNWE